MTVFEQSRIKQRLLGGVSAHLGAQAVTVLTQLLSLPIFLSKWSLAEYGIWITLSTIPAYLALADLGALTHAGNSMTMHSGRNDLAATKRVFSALLRVMLIMIPGIALLGALALAGAQATGHGAYSAALLWLGGGSLLALACQVYDVAYRAFGMYPLGTFLLTICRLMDWAGSLLGFYVFGDITSVAAGFCLGRLASALLIWPLTRRLIPRLEWTTAHASFKEALALLKSGSGFLAFPIGSAISLQGTLLLVTAQLGPAAGGSFAAVRTLTRFITQLAVLSGKALAPEIASLYGAGRLPEAARLGRKMFLSVMPLATAAAVLLSLFGEQIIDRWSHAVVPHDPWLLQGLIVVALVAAVWQLLATELTATNQHHLVAASFLVTAALGTAAAFVGVRHAGLHGVTLCLCAAEIAMLAVTGWALRQIQRSRATPLPPGPHAETD